MASKRARPSSGRTLQEPGNPTSSNKYIHIHCFEDTGRWGAWVREPKKGGKRLYVGTHLTDRLAARCQDRALLKLETDSSTSQPIKLNFDRQDYADDEHLRNTLSCAEFFKLLRGESRENYNKLQKTECLRRLMAQERALGNLPSTSSKKIVTLQNSGCNKDGLTESFGDSDDPNVRHNEEEDHSQDKIPPDEESANVTAQSTSSGSDYWITQNYSVAGATHDDGDSVTVCTTKFNWDGKRRRTSAKFAPDEAEAVQGLLLLSVAT